MRCKTTTPLLFTRVLSPLSLLAPFLLACSLLVSGCGGDDPAPAWESLDIGPIQSLSGVWGSGSDDVFIVGGDDDQGEIHHYDGSAWSKMALPSEVGLLVWSYGFGPSDVWTVGRLGALLHYDGSTWSMVDSKTDQDLWGVWGASANDVYMVGGNVFSGQVTILHWDGTEIQEEAFPDTANPLDVRALFKVFGVGGRLFAVGQKGLIVEREANGWVRHPAGQEADEDFVALWGNSADNIIAVGGRANSKISTFDGTTWTTSEPSQNFGGLNAVYVDAEGLVRVGGVNGAVGVWDSVARDVVYDPSNTILAVHAMWTDPDGKTYAVGGTFFDPHQGVVMTLDAK